MAKNLNTYTDIGKIFANKRKELKLSLPDVASKLKIRAAYLQAIEEGEIDKIPSGMYAAGYIKSYAKFLKIDIAAVEKSNDNLSQTQSDDVVNRNIKQISASTPGKGIIATSILLIIIINIICWLYN